LKRFIICAAALAVCAAGSAQVRLTPPDPVADRLVAEALKQTPEITAARANAEAARRRIIPARTLPDPSASFSYQNDGRGLSLGKAEGSFLGLMLSQPLPWPGKLSLAGKAAESEAREIQMGTVGRAERSIEARVRDAWYDLLLAHATDRLIEDRRKAAGQIEETVRQRYAAGLAVQQDVLRAEVEVARLDEAKASLQATIVSRDAELNRLLGQAQDTPVEASGELPAIASAPETAAVVNAVMARSPELAAARQGIETGRLGVALVKKSFLPDFVVNAGSMYRGSFEMGPMWQIGVGISIPAWVDRRQRNQLGEAEARLDVRTAESDRVSRELELRTRERLAQLEAANHVAALYHDKIVPLDEISLESALASYTAGKVPFITVLDALNTLYSDRALYLGRLTEAAKWRVAVDDASLEPTAMSGTPAMPGAGPSMTAQAPAGTAPSSNPSTSMR
jgi:cobalt-zinc-cadmium efflux system outer membrane protein